MNLLFPLGLLAVFLIASSNKTSTSTKSIPVKPKLALYKSYGVSEVSFNAGKKLLIGNKNIEGSITTAGDIRNGALKDKNVVIFLGGSGSQQGKDLKEEGRQIVREYVWNGGNYIGVCGGAYLALQGDEEFNKLAIVAGKNYGDYWQRGAGPALCKTNDGKQVTLHYENGPIFDRLEVQGLSPFISLATFESDYYIKSKGTMSGEMPGKPAIIISQYGKGKILLFSPNPIIGSKEELHPELMLNGIQWMVNNKTVPQNIKFSQIFGGL